MNNNSYKNEIIDDEDSQLYRRIHPDWYKQTVQPSVPKLYEQDITTITTKTINKELNSVTDEMTTTRLEKSPVRRVNLVCGPRSAFARLFPDKYRQQQRSKSSDSPRYNFDYARNPRIPSDDEDVSRSRQISFYNQQKKNPYLSDQHLSRIPLNYDPNPEIIYRDNPNKVVYVQKIGVRYLKPPTPPPPEPIIIREIQSPPPREPPPLVISTTP
jgi:hypothetical protein